MTVELEENINASSLVDLDRYVWVRAWRKNRDMIVRGACVPMSMCHIATKWLPVTSLATKRADNASLPKKKLG